MKIRNSHGHVVEVPRHHEKAIKKHIKNGNHKAVSKLVDSIGSGPRVYPPSNPAGMQEGPSMQRSVSPSGAQMEFGLGGYTLDPVTGKTPSLYGMGGNSIGARTYTGPKDILDMRTMRTTLHPSEMPLTRMYAQGGPVDPEQMEAMQGQQDQENPQEQMAEQQGMQGLNPNASPTAQQGPDPRQVAQAIQQMLQQGAKPEEVVAQMLQQQVDPNTLMQVFSQIGMPPQQVQGLIQNVMQSMQGAAPQQGGPQGAPQQGSGNVPINVEGSNFKQGTNPKKGELLVDPKSGRIVKDYSGRPPHPAEGQNPEGNDEALEGLVVIPKKRVQEYLEAGTGKKKKMIASIVSQQEERESKSNKMGDGGYYSFGGGDLGFKQGGPIGNPETIESMMGYGYKDGGKTKWIQKATASIKRRGTEGVCTGSKFGSSSCPPGSRRYNLAKTFKTMHHEHGGYAGNMYGEGGKLPESILRTRMEASGKSNDEINNYVNNYYAMGGETKMPDMNIVYKKGGSIYIKPANRGKFTIWAKSHGMGVQEAAQHVMANKDKYSSTIVKRANFAKNAARWKHEMGGALYKEGGPTTHDFPIRGLQYNYGGFTHNPMYTPFAHGGRLMYVNGGATDTSYTPYATEDISRNQTIEYTPRNQAITNYMSSGNYISNPTSGNYINYSNTNSTPLPSYLYPENATQPTSYDYSKGLGDTYDAARKEVPFLNWPNTTPPANWKGTPYSMDNFNPSNTGKYNYGNMAQDIAGAAPIAYNLIRGLTEKPIKMDPRQYMTSPVGFQGTRFDKTPYTEAGASLRYGTSQLSGPGRMQALTSGYGTLAGQAGKGFRDWQNNEALRRQQLGLSNAQIDAANKQMAMNVELMNQQAREKRMELLGKSTQQISDTFGKDPRYFAALAGNTGVAGRQPFTGWRS